MKRYATALLAMCSLMIAAAENYIESYHDLSDDYVGRIQDVEIVRPINGGTVITPEFDDSCPEEIKGPFSYACKIVEEYMPPCMPLRVAVRCETLRGSYANSVSRVQMYSDPQFGESGSKHLPKSAIKGIIVAEMGYNEYTSDFMCVDSEEYLTGDVDIAVLYNKDKLGEFSFSLGMPDDDQYDFISVAVRDLIVGLGLTHSFRYNPLTNGLELPSQSMIPFEKVLYEHLGNTDSPSILLKNATKGELSLFPKSTKSMRLYAPKSWDQSLSLRSFIPEDGCCVSQILSYDFGRGTVARSLSDDYATHIFHNLLKWVANVTTSTSSSGGASHDGSTSMLMPYGGSITLSMNNAGTSSLAQVDTNVASMSDGKRNIAPAGNVDRDEAVNYMMQFHPMGPGESYAHRTSGTTVSLLKKDGTWDVVKSSGYDISEMLTYEMSEFELHYDGNEYARTADGYLRARLTQATTSGQGKARYASKYFVIDYLPQRVALSYSRTPLAFVADAAEQSASTSSTQVRIYFKDLEGVDRVVLERLRPGTRVPSKTDITQFKRGYYDTTIDRTTLFTAVSYNKNGSSRSMQLEISPLTQTSSVKFELLKNAIRILSDKEYPVMYEYSISGLAFNRVNRVCSGTTTEVVDISSLSKGDYVLSVTSDDECGVNTFKFRTE